MLFFQTFLVLRQMNRKTTDNGINKGNTTTLWWSNWNFVCYFWTTNELQKI